MAEPRVIAAACDGACSGNPGPGGWGALLRFEDGAVRELGGADPSTTNNRMELTAALAVLEALQDLPRHPDLALRTDSRYLIDGLQAWLPGWKRKGWRTASGSPVLNRDLWERLERARLADVPLVHVRGHSGDPDNERCDAIAVAFSRGQMPQLSMGEIVSQARVRADRPAQAVSSPADPAPEPLQRLLSRLELAERLAQGGFSLSLLELAQLVEMPSRQLEQRQSPWIWREWRIVPLESGRWRLERDAGGLDTRL
ncbi:MAG: ribonuclease H [Synechococcus sp. ELA057]|jgi:ribonuclease HI